MTLTKLNILPIIVAIAAFLYFGSMAATDITWINTDSDSGIYLWSTKHLGLSHPTSSPLYNLTGYVLTNGADSLATAAHTLSLMSAFFSAATALLIYLECRRRTLDPKLSLIGPLVYCASGLVVSQSTIIETYAPITAAMVAMYYWRDSKWLFTIPAVLAVGIHHLAGLTLIPLLLYRRRPTDLWILLGGLFYVYYPFAQRPDATWSTLSPLNYFFGQNFLLGGIDPIEALPNRLYEGLLVIIGGFGVALIPIALRVKLIFQTKTYLLFLLALFPLIYYLTSIPPQTYVYTMPTFAFGAILAVEGLQHAHKQILYLTVVLSFVLLALNLSIYDIGNNLDSSPTSARRFIEQAESLPSNSIIYSSSRGWERVVSWNLENNITVVTASQLHTEPKWAHQITHISTIVDAPTYRVDILPCTTFPLCYNRRDRIDIK